jgi:hypothetical protein
LPRKFAGHAMRDLLGKALFVLAVLIIGVAYG